MPLCVRHATFGLAALLATSVADPAGATRRREAQPAETLKTRPAGEPLMAIVSLSNQRVTIYDADGWILRAPVSSGQTGYETRAGIYSIIQKEEEHYSNLSPPCPSCSASPGRASRSTRDRCPDTPPLTAEFACRMSSPNVSST
jgi:L,D-transpeptidase catalytic domain